MTLILRELLGCEHALAALYEVTHEPAAACKEHMHSHAGMFAPTCSMEQTRCQGQTLHVIAVGYSEHEKYGRLRERV